MRLPRILAVLFFVTLSGAVGFAWATRCPKRGSSLQRWPTQDPSTTHPRVILVGDSIMHLAAAVVARRHAGVLDHAINGYTAALMAENVQADVVAYAPAAVVVEGGVNDLTGGVAVRRIMRDRAAIVSAAHAAGIKVYLANMVPFQCATPGINRQRATAQLNAHARALCATGQCSLLDFDTALGHTFASSLFADCEHPNARGIALMVRTIERVIK